MNVGIWIRVSTQGQADTDSPLHHKLRAEDYCKYKDHQVVTVYDLSGVSGADVDQHPEFHRMMKDIEVGKIRGLVFSKLARLARSTSMLLHVGDHYIKHKATLISLDEDIDTSSSMGRMFFTLLAAFAEFEREQIRERVLASVVTRAKLGKRLGGEAPFGYQWAPDPETGAVRIGIHHEEAVVVRRIFSEFILKQKVRSVAITLDKSGLRTRNNNSWEKMDQVIKRILTNRIYIGKYLRNYTRRTKKGGTDRFKPESEWITIDISPLIEQETFEEVQRILSARNIRYQKCVPKTGKYLFSGIMKCSCGEKMYVNTYKTMKTPRYICRKCHMKVWESTVVEGVMEYVKSISVSPEMLRLRVHDQDIVQLISQKDNAQQELHKTEKAVKRLYDLYADGFITTSKELADKQGSRQEKITQLTEEIDRLSERICLFEHEDLARENVVKEAVRLGEMWGDFTYEERARLLQSVVTEVFVEKNSIKIGVSAITALKTDKSMERGSHTQGFIAATSMTLAG